MEPTPPSSTSRLVRRHTVNPRQIRMAAHQLTQKEEEIKLRTAKSMRNFRRQTLGNTKALMGSIQSVRSEEDTLTPRGTASSAPYEAPNFNGVMRPVSSARPPNYQDSDVHFVRPSLRRESAPRAKLVPSPVLLELAEAEAYDPMSPRLDRDITTLFEQLEHVAAMHRAAAKPVVEHHVKPQKKPSVVNMGTGAAQSCVGQLKIDVNLHGNIMRSLQHLREDKDSRMGFERYLVHKMQQRQEQSRPQTARTEASSWSPRTLTPREREEQAERVRLRKAQLEDEYMQRKEAQAVRREVEAEQRAYQSHMNQRAMWWLAAIRAQAFAANLDAARRTAPKNAPALGFKKASYLMRFTSNMLAVAQRRRQRKFRVVRIAIRWMVELFRIRRLAHMRHHCAPIVIGFLRTVNRNKPFTYFMQKFSERVRNCQRLARRYIASTRNRVAWCLLQWHFLDKFQRSARIQQPDAYTAKSIEWAAEKVAELTSKHIPVQTTVKLPIIMEYVSQHRRKLMRAMGQRMQGRKSTRDEDGEKWLGLGFHMKAKQVDRKDAPGTIPFAPVIPEARFSRCIAQGRRQQKLALEDMYLVRRKHHSFLSASDFAIAFHTLVQADVFSDKEHELELLLEYAPWLHDVPRTSLPRASELVNNVRRFAGTVVQAHERAAARIASTSPDTDPTPQTPQSSIVPMSPRGARSFRFSPKRK